MYKKWNQLDLNTKFKLIEEFYEKRKKRDSVIQLIFIILVLLGMLFMISWIINFFSGNFDKIGTVVFILIGIMIIVVTLFKFSPSNSKAVDFDKYVLQNGVLIEGNYVVNKNSPKKIINDLKSVTITHDNMIKFWNHNKKNYMIK